MTEDISFDAAIEKLSRRADEAETQCAHLATLLGESDSSRFAMEKVLTSIHNQFWSVLHNQAPDPSNRCIICEMEGPT